MFLQEMAYENRPSKRNHKIIPPKNVLTLSFPFPFNNFTANIFNHFTKWSLYLVKIYSVKVFFLTQLL